MPRRILIVDDSAVERAHLRSVLESENYEVLEGEHGAVGLRLAAEGDLSLILTDMNMPIMNGIQMLRGIRKLRQHADTPALVVTTESSAGLIRDAKEAGAAAWIIKPFKPRLLLAAVDKLLKDKQGS